MGVYAGPEINESGLVLSLDAGNTKSYPGSGTTWTDISGRSNTGTLTNGPTYSSANGGSIVFDGGDDGVSTNASMTGVQTFTAISWIRTTNTGGYNFIFSAGSFGSPTIAGWGLVINGTNLRFDHCNITTVMDFNVPSIYDGTWRQVGIYRDSNNIAGIIVNGVVVITINYNVAFTNTTFSLGYRPGGTTYNPFFGGNIAQASVYNRALSAAEVSQNFNALRGRFGI